jgi:hypothetical protein
MIELSTSGSVVDARHGYQEVVYHLLIESFDQGLIWQMADKTVVFEKRLWPWD